MLYEWLKRHWRQDSPRLKYLNSCWSRDEQGRRVHLIWPELWKKRNKEDKNGDTTITNCR